MRREEWRMIILWVMRLLSDWVGGELCRALQLSVMLPEPAHLPDLWSSSSLPIIHLTAVWSPGVYARIDAGVKYTICHHVNPNPYYLISLFFFLKRGLSCATEYNIILHFVKGYVTCIWERSMGSDSEWYCISTCSKGKRAEVKGSVKAEQQQKSIGVTWS